MAVICDSVKTTLKSIMGQSKLTNVQSIYSTSIKTNHCVINDCGKHLANTKKSKSDTTAYKKSTSSPTLGPRSYRERLCKQIN